MIDWNGDGKIDPIDIGVTMTMLDDDDKKPGSPKGSGCLTALITLAIFILGTVLILAAII